VRSEEVPPPSPLILTGTSAEQACLNALNKDARAIAKAHADHIVDCLKNYTNGKVPDAEACLASDPKGLATIAKAEGKAYANFARRCADDPSPIESADQIIDAAAEKEADLFAKVFGATLNDLTVVSTSRNETKCIQRIAKALFKCQDAKMKEFLKCKKAGLKTGAITSAQELQDECLGTGASAQPDPKNRIAKKCTDTLRAGIFKNMARKCRGVEDVDLTRAFGNGDCAAEAAAGGTALEECLERIVECEVCEMWNAADGLDRRCDLFDNGLLDGSCGPGPGACSPG
jgi:hypothetical protein